MSDTEEKSAQEVSQEDVFKNVTYYLVGDINENVVKQLDDGGAKLDSYLSEMVSHVIADDIEADECAEAKDLFDLPIVSSAWVGLSVKCKKQLLKEVFALEGLVFSGVVVCVSQLDEEDRKSLWSMVTYHGGRCQTRLDKHVTHLVTFTTEGKKYTEAMKRAEKIKIVCPDWITDSIQEKKKVDESIYHPRLIEYPKPESPPKPKTPETEILTPTRNLAISPGPGQQLAQQIAAGLRLKSSSEEMPRNGSRPGTPSSSSAKEALARMVNSRLQQSRVGDSPEARPAPPSPLFPHPHPSLPPGQHPLTPQMAPGQTPPLINPQMMTFNPLQDPGMGNRTLRNITNNAEQAQHGLRPGMNKIHQMFNMPRHVRPPPPYPIPPHTLQVLPQFWGHDPADNIPPDMCLLGCVFYVTDYQAILGQEEINTWKQVIEQYGGQVDSSYSSRITHLLCATQFSDVFQLALKDQKRVVTAFWLNDCLLQKKLLPPWQGLHLPQVYRDQKPCSNQIICMTNYDGEERQRIKQMINAIGAKYTGYMTHSNSVLICKKPEGLKYDKAKDWRIPVVNVHWLTDLVIGNLDALRLPVHVKYLQLGQPNEFSMDIVKVQGFMGGWKTHLKVSKEAWKKFIPAAKLRPQPAPGQENPGVKHKLSESEKDEPLAKKPRLESNGNSTQPRVMFTGYPKGIVKRLQQIVNDLGGVLVDNPRDCSHLVSQIFSRTMKFFVAINVCKFILTKEWLEESLIQSKFLDESKYHLNDLKGETEIGCKLSESLQRAKSKPLFQGLTFHITPGVAPPVCDVRNIVESAGGTTVKRRPSAKTIAAQMDDKGRPKFIVITCVNDIHLCRDLLAKKIPVYNAEFVLTGVLRQEVNFDIFRLGAH
ncbi:PAX-interacting protein 1-like [Haliotis rubra]|uniref:PAX-interacting protein 1-like n=1 Tax=Haliotis rubra TaxID=36100 RepID=UPI001EE5EFFA|nr:PAX-interacting protein 1-like [Haliotis rubra]